uniref:RNA-directed DNA polymerase, eukaryota n=1 Tax=Tanacetum cinerariifolium TaxID=118510 RepID=A0A699HKK2_TANCI|nr:RNA-directed DNA polymerase, eukaryota [Tanacetum cinerariifolium]
MVFFMWVLHSHCKKHVGDSHNTRFWYDSWVFDQSLHVRFPRLFALETDIESTVASKLGSSTVDASFRRSFRDGVERHQWDDLNFVSGSVTLSASKDRWICDLNSDGVFRIKEVRTILDDIFLPSAADAMRWVKYIPIKINVFAWRARLDHLPTRINLVHRGVVLDSSVCPLCGLVHEDIHHVMFRCDTAKLVFHRICRWWDLDWHDLLSFSDWNAWFSAIRLPSRIKLILEGVFYVAWWHLWVYRNQSIFAATPPRRSVIFDDIVSCSFTCVEKLVNNLCTIWVGRLKLNANVTRFNRENLKSSRIIDKKEKRFNKSSHNTFHKTLGNKDIGNSFVNVVKGSGMSLETESTPTIVLDDECLNTKDLSCSLMGRVKEFTSLSNLKKVLCNEGFDVLKISYLGELWVLIKLESAKVKDLFKENGGANLCFSVLNQASEDFTLGGRITWVEVEEVPGWTPEFIKEEERDDVSVEDNHGGIHSDQEINNCNDVSDVEEVLETCFKVPEGQKGNPSEDPFGIYPLLNKDKNIREHKINEEESSLKYPLGFTPIGNLNEGHLDGGCAKKVNDEVTGDDNSFVHTVGGNENSGSVNKMSDSMGSCRLKKSGMPRTVITNSIKVAVNAAKQSSPRAAASTSTARYVNTAANRPTVNGRKPSSNLFHNSHSLVKRTFNQITAPNHSDLKEKINNVGTKAVVSVVQENRENAVKSLACWIWRLIENVIDHISKDSGSDMLKRFNYVDLQGKLKHMTRNKSFLTNYQEIDGGFVAFRGSPKGEAVSTACYVTNRVLVVKPHNKTPYEHFHGKFDGKAHEGFFVGYSLNSKAFRVFNNRTRIMEENLHIRFSESTPNVVSSRLDWLFDIDALTRTMNYEPIVVGTQSNGFVGIKASDHLGQAKKET